MHYTIHENAESDAVASISFANLPRAVDILSGRAGLGGYIARQARLRRDGRIYVATNANGQWRRAGHRGGFVVRKVA